MGVMVMDKNNGYLTIKEYAEMAGVTEQAIYKRIRNLNNELADYVVVMDGRKYIEPEAVELLKPTEYRQPMQRDEIISEYERQHYLDMIDVLNKQIEQQTEQIAAQAMQLERKDAQLDNLLAQNKQLIESLAITADNLKTAQMLHAGTIQVNMKDGEQEEEATENDATKSSAGNATKHAANDNNDDKTENNMENMDNKVESESKQPQETNKKSWFQRFFGF